MARKPTPKQEKLVSLTILNALETKKTKTKKQLLAESGYSIASQDVPEKILSSETIQVEIKKRTEETIAKMQAHRDLMLSVVPKKVGKAPFNHLVNGIDIFTKNIQLLGGKATENKDIHISISEVVAQKNDLNVL